MGFLKHFTLYAIKKENQKGSLMRFLLELAGGIEPPTY